MASPLRLFTNSINSNLVWYLSNTKKMYLIHLEISKMRYQIFFIIVFGYIRNLQNHILALIKNTDFSKVTEHHINQVLKTLLRKLYKLVSFFWNLTNLEIYFWCEYFCWRIILNIIQRFDRYYVPIGQMY